MKDELQVVKSNHIISAAYRLSVAEQRVILTCIAQVRRDGPVTDAELYSVSAGAVAEIFSTDPKSAYRDLSEAASRLFDRRVTILLEPDGSGRHARKRNTRWVQTVDYLEGEGRVELRFSRDILPFLTGLTEQFTRYSLSAVASMTSAHAIRLFELLSQYGRIGKREIHIDDFRLWLDLGDTYPAIKDLKLRVITPAVDQINEHSPLEVMWDQRKTGRVVTHLIFTFAPKATKTSAAEVKAKKVLSDAELARQARPGETWDQVRARLGVR